jgi:hypothetical protein
MLTHLPTTMVKGGHGVMGLESYKNMPEHKIGDHDRMYNEGREGFYGWCGLGGSTFYFNPDRKMAFSYVPSHFSMVEVFAAKSKELEVIA